MIPVFLLISVIWHGKIISMPQSHVLASHIMSDNPRAEWERRIKDKSQKSANLHLPVREWRSCSVAGDKSEACS